MIGSRSRRACALVAVVALGALCVAATSAGAAGRARAETNCKVVVAGAHWKIASRSGSNYTLAARDMPCATARPWAIKFTHLTGIGTGQTFKGPVGYTCRSLSTSSSGDKLVYSGVCTKGPHNHPFFEWGPKVG